MLRSIKSTHFSCIGLHSFFLTDKMVSRAGWNGPAGRSLEIPAIEEFLGKFWNEVYIVIRWNTASMEKCCEKFYELSHMKQYTIVFVSFSYLRLVYYKWLDTSLYLLRWSAMKHNITCSLYTLLWAKLFPKKDARQF